MIILVTSEKLRVEIRHCYHMCDKYARNYYSWTTLQMLLPTYCVDDVSSYSSIFIFLRIHSFICLFLHSYSAHAFITKIP